MRLYLALGVGLPCGVPRVVPVRLAEDGNNRSNAQGLASKAAAGYSWERSVRVAGFNCGRVVEVTEEAWVEPL